MSGLKQTTMVKVLTDFSILFDKPLVKPKIDIFWKVFKSWGEQEFIVVSEKLLKKCKYMPTIADYYDENQVAATREQGRRNDDMLRRAGCL